MFVALVSALTLLAALVLVRWLAAGQHCRNFARCNVPRGVTLPISLGALVWPRRFDVERL